ncbi:MAG: sterol carrier protein domain-containing protein, partial [Mobilitalea sp.]
TGRNLKCNNFFFTDIEGFQGLMNLLQTCSSDHQNVSFELPTDQFITPLLPEWSMGASKCEKIFRGMVRVINVEQVLKMTKYKGDGSITIQVTDTQIPQNNHTFLVNFKDSAALEVSITEHPADISLGISDFSRLIVGTCDPSSIEFMESVQVNTTLDKISKVFYKKPNHITENF